MPLTSALGTSSSTLGASLVLGVPPPLGTPLAVSFEQGACNAIAAWIYSQLSFLYPVFAAEARWPNPAKPLPERAVTVLPAGPLEETPVDPVVLDQTPIGTNAALLSWRVAAGRLPIQLDVWAKYDTWRDDLVQRLRTVLNAGVGATLGVANRDPFRHGVLLKFLASDNLNGFTDVYFDAPDIEQPTPDQVQRNEWRATYRGHADLDIVLAAPSVLIATAIVKLLVSEQSPAPAGQLYDITTVTATKVTHTEGP